MNRFLVLAVCLVLAGCSISPRRCEYREEFSRIEEMLFQIRKQVRDLSVDSEEIQCRALQIRFQLDQMNEKEGR